MWINLIFSLENRKEEFKNNNDELINVIDIKFIT